VNIFVVKTAEWRPNLCVDSKIIYLLKVGFHFLIKNIGFKLFIKCYREKYKKKMYSYCTNLDIPQLHFLSNHLQVGDTDNLDIMSPNNCAVNKIKKKKTFNIFLSLLMIHAVTRQCDYCTN